MHMPRRSVSCTHMLETLSALTRRPAYYAVTAFSALRMRPSVFFRADGVEYDLIQHIGRNRHCSQYTPVTEIRMLHLVSRLKALTL